MESLFHQPLACQPTQSHLLTASLYPSVLLVLATLPSLSLPGNTLPSHLCSSTWVGERGRRKTRLSSKVLVTTKLKRPQGIPLTSESHRSLLLNYLIFPPILEVEFRALVTLG